jgi:hypothetical protein
MLKQIYSKTMTTVCNICGKEKQTDLSNITVKKNADFNEWDNLIIECDCGSAEVFNLNIPENDTDEPFMTGELPLDEEIQRFYVRILQRIVREDFKRGK